MAAGTLLESFGPPELFLAFAGLTLLFLGTAALQRRRASTALRSSEARYRLLAESVGDLLSRHDRNGICLYVSPAAIPLLGYAPSELLGKSPCDLIHLEDVQRACAAYRGALEKGTAPAVLLRLNRKDRTEVWVEVKARLVESGEHGPEVVCTTRDVSDRKALEAQFRQVQKMDAIGRLAGGIAHDFNNLLTVINGMSDLLLQELPGEDPGRPLLEEIGRAGSRAAGLTRQLLAFSRRQILTLEIVNINDVVLGMVRMLRRLVSEDVRLTTGLTENLALTRADIGQIEQVLLNLAVNARDAMPDGGELQIRTANVELGTTIDDHAFAVNPGPYVMLEVRDSGSGMTDTVKAHLFEPFFTTKEPGKGTGLGLATVYGIVKQSEGYITVVSSPGQGATFRIYLPRKAGNPQSETQSAPSPMPGPAGRELVLLVEDDDAVRALTTLVLRRCGYHVLEAQDGRDALAVKVQSSEPIALLVTDVVMPYMNGRELADRLRSQQPGLRVLYLSGYTDDAILRLGVLDRGVHFLQKPFTPQELAVKVREVLDEEATARSSPSVDASRVWRRNRTPSM